MRLELRVVGTKYFPEPKTQYKSQSGLPFVALMFIILYNVKKYERRLKDSMNNVPQLKFQGCDKIMNVSSANNTGKTVFLNIEYSCPIFWGKFGETFYSAAKLACQRQL